MHKTQGWLGTMMISPDRDITAGEIFEWTFTYTAGKYGIDDGGSLRIAWRSVSDWSVPQFTQIDQIGYTTVETTGKAQVDISYSRFVRPFGNSLLIRIHHGFLQEGDQVIIRLGDRRFGSLGIQAQTFCERAHEFRTYVDSCATARYEILPVYPSVSIIPAYPHEIQAVVPGTIEVGKEFQILIRVLDEFGNPTHRYNGTISLSLSGAEGIIPERITMSAENHGTVRLSHCNIKSQGIWHLCIKDNLFQFQAFSNPSLAQKKGQFQLFWGDMHGQTGYTVGTGNLDDYYTFARDKAGVDFTGWQGNDFEITEDAWNDVRAKTKKYDKKGQFLVYLGYEWSGVTPQGGDHNVFFLNDEKEFHPSSNWSSQSSSVHMKEANPLTELCRMYRGRTDIILIPHVGGRYANFDYFDPEFMKVIEIHSHHGIFEWFAFDAMKRRMKVGFIAASDDHTCRPGLSYPLSGHGKSSSSAFNVTSGYTGVWASELKKESVWEAIRDRRCYASTTDRLFLKTMMGSHWMGEEFHTSGNQRLSISAAGRFPLEEIRVFDWEREIDVIPLIPHDFHRIRIRWSGVIYKGRQKTADWNGMLAIENGFIRSAEAYAIDRIDQGIILQTDRYVTWTSSTSGDYDGIVLDIEGDGNTVIHFHSHQGNLDIPLKELDGGDLTYHMGGENLMVEVGFASRKISESEREKYTQCEKIIEVPRERGEHAYWVKVTQVNGNAAWSSPIFVTRE